MLVDEAGDVGQRRLRARVGAGVGIAQQRQDPPQLGDAPLAAGLDAGERLVAARASSSSR
ncbi:MAG: hypothetical protein ACR2H2_02905 [Solirubrobacteraceae bacterium]